MIFENVFDGKDPIMHLWFISTLNLAKINYSDVKKLFHIASSIYHLTPYTEKT